MAKVLVADDDPGTLAFVEALLAGEGHTVQTAKDGASALDRARGFKPDVLVTDVRMPGLTGNQLAAAVRALDRMRHVYILVLTVAAEKEDRMKAFLSGADDFIVKPARAGELLGRIEIGLRLQKSENAAREAAARSDGMAVLLKGLAQELDSIAVNIGKARAAAARSGDPALLQSTEDALVGAEQSARMIRLRIEAAGGDKPASA
jgi:DNA-binding response OmpR family regulator